MKTNNKLIDFILIIDSTFYPKLTDALDLCGMCRLKKMSHFRDKPRVMVDDYPNRKSNNIVLRIDVQHQHRLRWWKTLVLPVVVLNFLQYRRQNQFVVVILFHPVRNESGVHAEVNLLENGNWWNVVNTRITNYYLPVLVILVHAF